MSPNSKHNPEPQSANNLLAAQAHANFNEALALHQRGALKEAQAIYLDILKKQPTHCESLHLLGVIAHQTNNHQLAVDLIGKAIDLCPHNAAFYNNRGIALKNLKQLDAAVASYDKAISLNPDYADAYYNRGIALKALNQLDAAVASYDKAISLNPNHTEVYWNKSLALLLSGDYENGWKHYEWRWKKDDMVKRERTYAKPLWLGTESLQDQTIVLHAEQGLGDTIQFSRYAKIVADLGARVILEVQKPLIGLFETLEGVTKLIAKGDALSPFDYHCPLLSLPLACKTTITTIPRSTFYLRSDPAKVAHWLQRLGTKTKPRVGLVWNGGFRPNKPEIWQENERRNMPVQKLCMLKPFNLMWVSLQKGDPAETEFKQLQQVGWDGPDILNCTDDLKDFSDTAALIGTLDLVITVDTATAHLAGALGKPVWLLNRFDSCWRWLLEREDTPWYPSMRIYRQPTLGDWDSVIQRVCNDLNKQFF